MAAIDENEDGVISDAEFRQAKDKGLIPTAGQKDPTSLEAFMANLGLPENSSAEWFDEFNRQSGESFTSGAAQIVAQSLQDMKLGMLNAIQQSLLAQAESGAETITYPQGLIDGLENSGSEYDQVIDYVDRMFDNQTEMSRGQLLGNPEFYTVGINYIINIRDRWACGGSKIRLGDN